MRRVPSSDRYRYRHLYFANEYALMAVIDCLIDCLSSLSCRTEKTSLSTNSQVSQLELFSRLMLPAHSSVSYIILLKKGLDVKGAH